MKPSALLLIVVLAAGGALAWVGLRAVLAGPSDYRAPSLEERPEAIPVKLSGDVPAGYVVREFGVEGMCCAGCPIKLRDALAGLPEVGEIAIDPILGSASVVVPEGLEVERLESAMTFGDYTAQAR